MSQLLNHIDLHFDFISQKLSNVTINDAGCWVYQGNLRGGYGRINICAKEGKRKYAAHRVAYAYHTGIDPGERFVCHKCDNPTCINPEHLFLGTAKDNTQDMHQKGRAAPQAMEANPSAKITEADVLNVVAMIKSGRNNKEIAQSLPVTHGLVSLIRLGKAWKPLLAKIGYDPTSYRRRKAA